MINIIHEPYCPICETPKENKGSHNIKICSECYKIFEDAIVAQIEPVGKIESPKQ